MTNCRTKGKVWKIIFEQGEKVVWMGKLRDRKVEIRTFEKRAKSFNPHMLYFCVFVLAKLFVLFNFFFFIYKVLLHAYSHRRLTTIHFYHSNVYIYEGNVGGSWRVVKWSHKLYDDLLPAFIDVWEEKFTLIPRTTSIDINIKSHKFYIFSI